MAEKRTRNYMAQRNYTYETQHADSKFYGLTKDEWKDMIRSEWTWDKVKANHIIFNFHDKCKDENGIEKDLHVHGCINFTDGITQSEAMKRTGCSCEDNCKAIKKKSQAYRYLLHITEQAIKDGKHIYSEDELEYSVASGKTCDYHKLIKSSSDEEDAQADASLLKTTIGLIRMGAYGDGSNTEEIMQKLVLDKEIFELLTKKPSNARTIENAVKYKQREYFATKRQKQTQN